MTRKDYELIAGALHRSGMAMNIGKKRTAHDGIRLVTIDLAATLAHENALFDRERFLKACGVQS